MAETNTVNGMIEYINVDNATHAIASTAYGYCETVAGTAIKDVSMPGFKLKTGVTVHIKFANTNSAANPKLKFNNENDENAKPIMQYGETAVGTTAGTTGWNKGAVVTLTYDGANWIRDQGYNTNTTYNLTEVWCNTAADTPAKTFSNANYYTANDKSYFEITFRHSNTAQSELTLNGKTLYIDGKPSSSSNYTLPAGKYLVYYENEIYYIRTDGKITGDITGDAATVNGHTVEKDVPSNAVFTDTNKYHKSGSWSGLTYTATAINNAEELQFTIPTGSTSTTVAVGNHNHDIDNLTNASSYLKWQTTTAKSTELYDFGIYVNQNSAAGSSMTNKNYFSILNIPRAKASGNTKADYGWQLGNITENDGRLWYRTAGNNVWGDWQTIAHATQSTSDTGGSSQPVYMTKTGVITPITAVGAAYGGTGQTTLNDSANVLINALTEGTSPATANDYLIAQYVGGGTTTTTYHRRKVSNVVNATVVKAALGTDSSTITQWLNKKGEWSTPTAVDVGAITKLSSSTDNAIVRFDGTSGAIQNSGVTIDDNDHLIAPAIRIANTYYGISFGRTTSTPVETILHTGIKWANNLHMPVIHITGYAFGLQSPVEFKIGFYIYNDKIGYCSATNMSSWQPDIYLYKDIRDDTNYVAIGLAGRCYFLQLSVDVQDEMGKFDNISTDSSNWSWEFLTTTGNIPQTDDGTSCCSVPYKASIFSAKNAQITTTTNAIAYYTNTTGTFGSKASANGALYATSANGALQWGTLPIAQGGTGETTANAAANALISSLSTWTAAPTADTYFIRRDTNGTAVFGQVKFSSIANITNGKITLGPYSITPVTSVNGHTGSSVNVTAADLGLSNALHFIGITSTELTDGSTTATLTAKSTNSLSKTTNFVDGDVVMDGDQLREYVWSGNAWRLLGITTSTEYSETTSGNTFISSIRQGTDGKITADSRALDTTGTWSGTADKATTTADTSNTLYVVGVMSGATTTLKRDTSVTIKGGAVSATTYNGLTLTAIPTGFTIADETTSKALTVSDTLTLETGKKSYIAYYSAKGTISGHSLAHISDTWSSSTKNGKNELVLGNSIASTANGSAYGQLALYSENTAGTQLKSASSTSWTIATLQAKTGTIALMSDVTESKVEIIRLA